MTTDTQAQSLELDITHNDIPYQIGCEPCETHGWYWWALNADTCDVLDSGFCRAQIIGLGRATMALGKLS